MLVSMVTLLGSAAFAVVWATRRPPSVAPEYVLTDDGPRAEVLVWSAGRARFALGQPPSVSVVQLPDRKVRLAPGCDHAQIRVDVREGQPSRVEVLVGEIVEERQR
jgi:hypothetical protein